MAVIKGTLIGDYLPGTELDDYIYGDAGDDQIHGNGGNDTIFGGTGSDSITDGAGSDRIDGGDGTDFISMAQDNSADSVSGGKGLDYVEYLTPNAVRTVVDFLDQSKNSGSAAGDRFTGVEGYIGSASIDVVFGSGNDDYFVGSEGSDRYFGRDGFDSYFAAADTGDPIEIAFGARAAALAAAAGISAPAAGQAIAYSWVDANGNGKQDSGEATRYAHVLSSIEYFGGTINADTLRGSSADEFFAPRVGKDIVDGEGGFDFLYYGNVSQTVTVDLAAHKSTTLVFDAGQGTYVPVASTILNIEGVVGGTADDQVQGDDAQNALYGRDGHDALDGRGGDDVLFGGKGGDILVGGNGDDILDGGEGADVLAGGAGIDIASYVAAPGAVQVSLLRGEGVGGAYAAGDVLIDIEYLIGATFNDTFTGDDDANTIEGRAGKDEVNGCGGDDIIYGESAPNSPIEDYHQEPDLSDASIIDDCECDPDAGNHDISDEYDDKLYGAEGNDQIFGQLGEDELWGGNGDDRLQGGEGNDILDGGNGVDILDGGLGSDFIYGGVGNDIISGGAGFDIIFGGDGTDTVSYDASPGAVTVNLGTFWQSGGDASSDLLDEMMNNLANGATAYDIVWSALFINLLESLASTGNEPAFTLTIPDVLLSVESVTGSQFNDSLTGNATANVLSGGAGIDTLVGLGGDDRLNGGLGADKMKGGTGNDTYLVDNASDVVTEAAGEGTDRVLTSVTYTLGSNVENLAMLGSSAINGVGNELANTIEGNDAANVINAGAGNDVVKGLGGNDQLVGSLGNDQLTGGSGADIFIFNTALNASTNVDTIGDFSVTDDTIRLSQSIFSAIGSTGTLAASAFRGGTAAGDSDDRIIYDQASGRLYYDADGNGAGAAILFAKVAPGTALTNSDIQVFSASSATSAPAATAAANFALPTISSPASELAAIEGGEHVWLLGGTHAGEFAAI